jgi:hypothetical protein
VIEQQRLRLLPAGGLALALFALLGVIATGCCPGDCAEPSVASAGESTPEAGPVGSPPAGALPRPHFINPDLPLTEPSNERLERLVAGLAELFDAERRAGRVTRFAVHLRELRTGQVAGLHNDEPFIPASLLKLPIALALFDLEEERPGTLDTRVRYSPEGVVHFEMLEQYELPGSNLVLGESYDLASLLSESLTRSDNLAYYLLLEYLNYEVDDGRFRIRRTFSELGIVDPEWTEQEVLTVRGYAALFRTLFNASYLTARHSETVLSWLAASTFDRGLAAGLPAGVTLANKFGERLLDDGRKQLHDCGIVYAANPYSICVMTMGKDWDELRSVIAGVSRRVWKELGTPGPEAVQ